MKGVLGYVPVVGPAVKMIKTYPFEAGQVEYELSVEYQKNHPLYRKWRIEVEYRVGNYRTSEGEYEEGVIEAIYTPSYYEQREWGFVPDRRNAEHAP